VISEASSTSASMKAVLAGRRQRHKKFRLDRKSPHREYGIRSELSPMSWQERKRKLKGAYLPFASPITWGSRGRSSCEVSLPFGRRGERFGP
jgi:hypothetical protein